MKWEKLKHVEENNYEIPGNILYPHYYEALNALFRIENALRIIVYIVLKDSFRNKWNEINITSDDEASTTINAIAKRRINQDNNFAYLGYENSNPLMYLTSGELIRIITSEQYWKFFKSYFLGSKEIMRNKLDEIGNIRNSLAHFRPLKPGDVDLIKQNAIHSLSKIEETIVNILKCSTAVPSNNEEDWYKGLSTLGNKYVRLIFRQSPDESWINIGLLFNAPIFQRQMITDGLTRYDTIRLSTPDIFYNFPNLKKLVIFASERTPFLFEKEDEPKFRKSVDMRISRKIISEEWSDLKIEIESILKTIDVEIELIKQDNLAKGSLVELTTIKGDKTEGGYWSYETNKLKSIAKKSDPVEFWDSFGSTSDDYITDTDSFPWMSTKISEDKTDLPF